MMPSIEQPWPKAPAEKCFWYHTMRFPDGEVIPGTWDIPDFASYLGNYDINGKTLLDIGTASGFIAFNAERAGAIVTGLDARSAVEFRHVPFAETLSYRDIVTSRRHWTDENLIPIKNAWWHGWHRFQSRAECIYAPHAELYEWDRQFDVVVAGAIVGHLSDPVYAIGAWARVAREALIIPWTEIIDSQELKMVPMTRWDDPRFFHAWWNLSEGLWRRIFDNLGFDFSWTKTSATYISERDGVQSAEHPVIIARRR